MLSTVCTLSLVLGCAGASDEFVPDPEDEAVDPADPPVDPDPVDVAERLPTVDLSTEAVPTEEAAIAMKASCPKRSRTLSPTGLTFAIHISRKEDNGWAAYRQLKSVRNHIRARDVFIIEGKSAWVLALRQVFPCNEFHFIAYPDELDAALATASLVDAIIVDWETAVWTHTQDWSIDKLSGYADKFHSKGLGAAIAAYWPAAFDDGHITRASHMNYELAQIQDHCAHDGARAFAAAARSLVGNFRANGMGARDIGFEISLDSVGSADNHTDIDRSAACSRRAYGKGARAIYLYGNGSPHLAGYFDAIHSLGLR